MKLLNTSICLTSRRSLLVIAILLISTLVIAGVITEKKVIIKDEDKEVWIPSAEDIAYQDSMFSIVEKTQSDIDTIKVAIDDILWKLEKLDYPDGTWDSIRYVKGEKIDKKRNKQ